MPSSADPVSRFYPDWPQYASRIVAAVRDRSPEQLAIRASPDHAPIWAITAHCAGVRVYWLCGVFGEPGADATPFPDPFAEVGWEDDESHPRTASELVGALLTTWAIVDDCLRRWTPAMLGETFERRYGEIVQQHTRASVLNPLMSHDAFHAGEISQLLGSHGLGSIDLWARDPRA